MIDSSDFKKKYFYSLGCGIGYGYLHRIPTRPFEEGKKISLPGQMTGTPITPLKDGFTEVRRHYYLNRSRHFHQNKSDVSA